MNVGEIVQLVGVIVAIVGSIAALITAIGTRRDAVRKSQLDQVDQAIKVTDQTVEIVSKQNEILVAENTRLIKRNDALVERIDRLEAAVDALKADQAKRIDELEREHAAQIERMRNNAIEMGQRLTSETALRKQSEARIKEMQTEIDALTEKVRVLESAQAPTGGESTAQTGAA